MRVKICGITNLQDALDAIQAGADALGFVFYEKSPRYIEPKRAKEIISKLPPFVQTVGLFVNVYAAQADFICKISGVDLAQIHFEADEKFYNSLQTKALKVVRVKEKSDLNIYSDQYRIVDAFVKSYGGEGKQINLDWFKDTDCSRIILAGGLNIDNIDKLKGYNFYSLDISSGVEKDKGLKSKEKMQNFMDKVNEIFR